MTTLPVLLVALGDRLQDGEEIIKLHQRQLALTEAVKDLARFRPRLLVGDIVGNGTSTYTLPAGWVVDVSSLLSLEFPLGNDPPTYLEESDWTLYRSASTTVQLRLVRELPSASQTMRLLYTAPHTLGSTPATTTLTAVDEEPALNKAASLCCTWLAAYYAQQGQASLAADVTNHESKSRTYRDLAKDFQRLYNEALGIDTKDGQAPVKAASAVGDWDNSYPWGEDRLTHPQRWY
jgi:hypothetical protein